MMPVTLAAVTVPCRPDFAGRRLAAAALLALAACTASACGNDETLDVSTAPPDGFTTATVSTSARPKPPPGTLDVCAAFAAFAGEPAATEALCVALGASNGAGSAKHAEARCQQCALAASVVLTLSPEPSCPRSFEDCSATDADLERCAREAGAGLAQTDASCASANAGSLSRDDVLIALTTRSCTQVILNCPAAIDALTNALDVFGDATPRMSR